MKAGWEVKKLGELCEFQRGLTYSKGDEVEFSKNIVLRATNIDLKTNSLDFSELKYINEKVIVPSSKKVKKDSLIICTASGSKIHLGKVAHIDDNYDYAFGGFMGMITPTNGLSPKYLFYLMTSSYYKDFIGELSDGANINNLKFDNLKKFEVPLPPLPEQQRLVTLLDEAFEGLASAIANTEQNLRNSKELFESLLNVALQGKLIPQNAGDDSVKKLVGEIEKLREVAIAEGKAKPEKSKLLDSKEKNFELPRSWEYVQLESLTVNISDGVHKKPHYVANGIPFVTVRNLTTGPGISFDELNHITQEDHEEFIKRTHPENGDILITKDGTIGVVRLIETDIEFSIFVSVALIKPVMLKMGQYLVYALRAECVQSQIVPQGAALKHLYLIDLRKLRIPLPPLTEQKRIVDKLDEISMHIGYLSSLYHRKLTALAELKKSLLHQAFSGTL